MAKSSVNVSNLVLGLVLSTSKFPGFTRDEAFFRDQWSVSSSRAVEGSQNSLVAVIDMGLDVPLPGCHNALLQPVGQLNIAAYTLTINGVFRHTVTPDSSPNTPAELETDCKMVNVTRAQIYTPKYL